MTRAERKKQDTLRETTKAYDLGVEFARQARHIDNLDQVRSNGANRLSAAGLWSKRDQALNIGYFEFGYETERQRLNPAVAESDVDEITRMRLPAPPLGFRQGMNR